MTRAHRILLLLAGVFTLTPWASPALALALGAAIALSLGNPEPDLTRRLGRRLLQVSVVGLGFGMPAGAVLAAGAAGIGYTTAGIVAAITVGLLLGRWLRIERHASVLITAGTSICGGSAIAAIGPAIGAGHEAMTVALATVFVLNAVALYLFPVIGHALHLSQHQFAVWAALGIHDTSSVVGAAASYGAAALQEATVLKLVRALWIIPLTLAAAMLAPRWGLGTGTSRRLRLPWFIGLFVVAALLRSMLPAEMTPLLDGLARAARVALVLTLYLIGLGLTRGTLRQVGHRPLLQGVLLWALLGGATLVAVREWVTG